MNLRKNLTLHTYKGYVVEAWQVSDTPEKWTARFCEIEEWIPYFEERLKEPVLIAETEVDFYKMLKSEDAQLCQ